tara:strand:+ start:388 stop:990 length:603 start_codon:yes stop_codon:yes gene_type:complete
MYNALFAGFTLGISLILAIGAQNAFVLKQGISRQHVFWVCLCCASSDAVLIALGVSGFAEVVTLFPWIDPVTRYGGALFLCVYALLSFKSAIYERVSMDSSEAIRPQSLIAALLTCLALTYLNPHVYLDTVVLLGSVSVQYGDNRAYFALGAVISSFVFFFSLGYCSRFLAPLFARSSAWQLLNILVGLIMLVIAVSLVI